MDMTPQFLLLIGQLFTPQYGFISPESSTDRFIKRSDCGGSPEDDAPHLELLDVQKIWDRAPHNAFTSLVRFQDQWFVTFREGRRHSVTASGREPAKARILRSPDARTWTTAAVLGYESDKDIYGPKLSVTPNGRLMFNAAAASHTPGQPRKSVAWLSENGTKWLGPHDIGEPDWQLWRVTWGPGQKAYGIGYGPLSQKPWTTRLYRSLDGIHFESHIAQLTAQPGTNEATIRFLRDGRAVALVRREGKESNALVGVSRGDYSSWTFRESDVRIGGPDFLELPDGRIVAGARRYESNQQRTALYWLDPHSAKLTLALLLPSSGDTSYPGLVWHDGLLWVSYYSSHEGKASIYLARVTVHLRH